MPVPRFQSINATPPGGLYEYELNGVYVSARSRFDISREVRRMHAAAGILTLGDGFPHVMAYMCPKLPNGFCSEPSTIKMIHADQVKAKTKTLFNLPLVPVDIISKRLNKCVNGCPNHRVRGFCPTCSGLTTWVARGFSGNRPALPYDMGCGVCTEDLMLVAASASVVEFPETPGAKYPEGCWRRQKEVPNGGDR